ncbi:unnamed protein product [Phytophthora fragariaefolia]|uniref:Unnamed protein product n=1 Tax=Phytophthora fragariaefolia TaxID=1490495 RepID=A0A9W6XA47_9STRA|nr:unnamed protein product [Phytophthora fragariaefolia]
MYTLHKTLSGTLKDSYTLPNLLPTTHYKDGQTTRSRDPQPIHLQRAPTGFNTQSYVAMVVCSAEDRGKLVGAMMDSNSRKVKEAPVAVVFAADCEPNQNVPRLQQLGRDNGIPEAILSKVPHAVELFSGEHDPDVSTEAWAYKPTAFVAATFLYAAQVHGLATCTMEGLDQAKMKKALNIPDRYSIPVVVAIGHENPDAKPAKPSVRLPPKEVFFEGEFGQSLENLFDPVVSDTRKSRLEKFQQLPKFKQLPHVEASRM